MKAAQKTKELEIARGAGSLESRPGKQKLGDRSRNWARKVEGGPGREKAESEGRREERPELGDECGKLGLAEGARSEKDDLAPSAQGVHPARRGRSWFHP